ncbi:molybdopterin-dependent oxidoreductase [Sphingorhabdus arenilitoris]|uniref:Molybdopterin-dependent oxidoreductase n=1 Tax=Sphingorhabdus arenilitoris TaxID=1490041 RepID=A0ABV8RFR6_9SPHN
MIKGDKKPILPRRRFLQAAGAAAGGLLVTGCDALNDNAGVRQILSGAEKLHQGAQRIIMDRNALAREYRLADMSPKFRMNGSITGDTDEYQAHLAQRFANWKLKIDGMVARRASYSLAQLMAMPSREQITRHDCVEGWSAIGRWRGPQLGPLLDRSGLLPAARYLVFHCADRFGADAYYESIDLIDAFHPQTILAWGMNGAMLPTGHGAPIRLRVERQLGYKHAKFVMRIEATDDLTKFGQGKGGYWEDVADYAWYAGI